MDIQRVTYLYTKYLNGSLDSSEQQEFTLLINDPEFEAQFRSVFDRNWDSLQAEEMQGMSEQTQQEQVGHITGLPRTASRMIRLWPRIAVAAAMAIVIFGGGLFLYQQDKKSNPDALAYQGDVEPGKIGATLTLANGRKILLSDAKSGELAKEAGVMISKTADGQISYEIIGQDNQEAAKINTLSTANGETYVVVLPDRSKVWLNAASSLKYPSSFTAASQRRVELAGEAYFEIAKDRAHPFIVKTAGQEVEVLGTHFNINSYGNEPVVKTTLLEGSVKVTSSAGGDVVLKPDQQAINTGKGITVLPVTGDDAIAWKNGLFVFEDESLESIMRKVERWYDVEVEYVAGVNQKELYFGSVSRYDKVSKVLDALKSTGGLHFEIQGRRILVKK